MTTPAPHFSIVRNHTEELHRSDSCEDLLKVLSRYQADALYGLARAVLNEQNSDMEMRLDLVKVQTVGKIQISTVLRSVSVSFFNAI